ncbi:aspartic proteinase CDR1-like [Papaver somniferum]|uniref:aspartic proteinase CDR1-like n=1 Tax=Papaver somniferum TaxID=3469 RepID=UPI000E6FABAD|nr:aspartic proteinase CDR1-like [Papaver somniferum]
MCDDAGLCTYKDQYISESVTSGVLAKERFTVNSDNDGLESFNMIMGCGTNQVNFEPFFGLGHRRRQPDVIAGILGLDGNPRSFLSQLGPAGQGKFAYCLKPYTDGTALSTYLRFGSDARTGGEGQQVYQTPLFFHRYDPGAYYLNLEDIGVAEIRIRFQNRDFQYKEDTGRGGCFIDSGSPLTSLHEAHFDRVAEKVVAHFQGLDIRPLAGRRGQFDLCFSPKPKAVKDYPTMTFHFQHADFVVDSPDSVFYSFSNNEFCLGLSRVRSEYAYMNVVFGAVQQARKRILYDVMGGTLSFAKDECELAS